MAVLSTTELYLKMVKMAQFMICVFYHNKKMRDALKTELQISSWCRAVLTTPLS